MLYLSRLFSFPYIIAYLTYQYIAVTTNMSDDRERNNALIGSGVRQNGLNLVLICCTRNNMYTAFAYLYQKHGNDDPVYTRSRDSIICRETSMWTWGELFFRDYLRLPRFYNPKVIKKKKMSTIVYFDLSADEFELKFVYTGYLWSAQLKGQPDTVWHRWSGKGI